MTTFSGTSATRRSEPIWNEAVDECRRLLADLVALDTRNPPGNEILIARLLQPILEAQGIACRVFEPAPGRANLVARLAGTGAARPLLLLAHGDVVGVEPAKWASDPFQMVERDGHLYGRGVIDDKGMVAVAAVTLMWLARRGAQPARDVILLVECDEESGGQYGVRWMLEHQRASIDAELALNEGGRVTLAGDRSWVGLQTAEKRSINVTLTATGLAGHASMPRHDNSLVALARALDRAADPPFPATLTPETRAFFRDVAPLFPGEMGRAMNEVESRTEASVPMISRDLMFNAMLRHTVSPTVMSGGFRPNVIPASAQATLNVRMLPGADPATIVKEIERRVAGLGVAVTYATPPRPESPSMPFAGPVVEATRKAASRVLPGSVVVPFLSTGATDSAQLRAAGIQAYGLLPFPLSTEDSARMHGEDERMPVASLETGLKLFYEIVAEVAAG